MAQLDGAARAMICAYALWRGGGPERVAAVALGIAALGSALAARPDGAGWPLMDDALLATLTGIALCAPRFWPMWMAAVQLVVVIAQAYGPLVSSPTIVAAWAMLLMLAAGTMRHRAREADGGREADWTVAAW